MAEDLKKKALGFFKGILVQFRIEWFAFFNTMKSWNQVYFMEKKNKKTFTFKLSLDDDLI